MQKLYYFRTTTGEVHRSISSEAQPGNTPITRAAGAAAFREQVAARLREQLPKGSKVWGLVRSVAPSGMSRRISLYIVHGSRIVDITYRAGIVLERTEHRDGGLVVGGCGMDMVFSLVYDLGAALYADPSAFTKENL